MKLVNGNSIKGVFPRKGERHYKRINQFGKIEWLPCKTHKPAYCYNDSYLTVPPSVVHPDDLPSAERTRKGDVYLSTGMRLISAYKVGVHDGPDCAVFTITPPENGVITIERISYGNAHVAHTVWYTEATPDLKKD